MKTICVLSLTFVILFFYCPAACAGAAKLTKEAKRLYLGEKYGEAAEKYKKALDLKPDSDIIHFDAGAALYKKEDYENAIGESQKALSTENEPLEAKANYNIGNSKYRLQRLEEALDYYKRAIELDAKDEDAKFNYEFVEKKLTEKQDQEKQQKPPPEQEKEKQEEKKEEEEKKEKEEKPEEKKPEEPKADQKEDEKQDQKEDEKQDREEEQRTPEAPEPRKGSMSEEETQMLLEGHRQEEESMGDVQKERVRRLPEVLKDW